MLNIKISNTNKHYPMMKKMHYQDIKMKFSIITLLKQLKKRNILVKIVENITTQTLILRNANIAVDDLFNRKYIF
jgi:soluble P-type ATPase